MIDLEQNELLGKYVLGFKTCSGDYKKLICFKKQKSLLPDNKKLEKEYKDFYIMANFTVVADVKTKVSVSLYCNFQKTANIEANVAMGSLEEDDGCDKKVKEDLKKKETGNLYIIFYDALECREVNNFIVNEIKKMFSGDSGSKILACGDNYLMISNVVLEKLSKKDQISKEIPKRFVLSQYNSSFIDGDFGSFDKERLRKFTTLQDKHVLETLLRKYKDDNLTHSCNIVFSAWNEKYEKNKLKLDSITPEVNKIDAALASTRKFMKDFIWCFCGFCCVEFIRYCCNGCGDGEFSDEANVRDAYYRDVYSLIKEEKFDRRYTGATKEKYIIESFNKIKEDFCKSDQKNNQWYYNYSKLIVDLISTFVCTDAIDNMRIAFNGSPKSMLGFDKFGIMIFFEKNDGDVEFMVFDHLKEINMRDVEVLKSNLNYLVRLRRGDFKGDGDKVNCYSLCYLINGEMNKIFSFSFMKPFTLIKKNTNNNLSNVVSFLNQCIDSVIEKADPKMLDIADRDQVNECIVDKNVIIDFMPDMSVMAIDVDDCVEFDRSRILELCGDTDDCGDWIGVPQDCVVNEHDMHDISASSSSVYGIKKKNYMDFKNKDHVLDDEFAIAKIDIDLDRSSHANKPKKNFLKLLKSLNASLSYDAEKKSYVSFGDIGEDRASSGEFAMNPMGADCNSDNYVDKCKESIPTSLKLFRVSSSLLDLEKKDCVSSDADNNLSNDDLSVDCVDEDGNGKHDESVPMLLSLSRSFTSGNVSVVKQTSV